MILYDDLYCKIYLNSELSIDELYQYLNQIIQGKQEPIRIIKTNWGEIDLRKNKSFSPHRLDDFVYWQYYLDIEPKNTNEQNTYIYEIKNLLEMLKSKNIKAIASCDFEDNL